MANFTSIVGTSMSPFWILLELRVMEVVRTTGAIRCAKLQSKCRHQQTNTLFFTGRMPFLSANQQRQCTEGKNNRVAPDIISGPGPGRNPAVFFQIRPRPDMTAGFEARFFKFWRFEHHYFPVYFSDSISVSAKCKVKSPLFNNKYTPLLNI